MTVTIILLQTSLHNYKLHNCANGYKYRDVLPNFPIFLKFLKMIYSPRNTVFVLDQINESIDGRFLYITSTTTILTELLMTRLSNEPCPVLKRSMILIRSLESAV